MAIGAKGKEGPKPRPAAGKGSEPKGKGLGRHFEGWQPGLLAVLIAGSVAAVVVPRPVDPIYVPEPAPDLRVLAHIAQVDDELADAAEKGERLDVDVRELGEAVRAYGRAEANRDQAQVVKQREAAAHAQLKALAAGPEHVLELRAYQMRTFLREIRRWEATGQLSDDLLALGGSFLSTARLNHWLEESRGSRRMKMTPAVVSAMFKKRWSEITTIHGGPFNLSLDESRAFYGFLIRNPFPDAPFTIAPSAPHGAALRRSYEEQFQLKKVDELAAVDPTYPRDLARGVVLYRMHRFPLAVDAFRKHLDTSPDGPYALRAQNYLRAALGHAAQ